MNTAKLPTARGELLAIAFMLLATTCLHAQTPQTPYVYQIRPVGVVTVRPESPAAAVALVITPGDTVFVQAVNANTVALWSNGAVAGRTGITLHRGEPIPAPDAVPVLCALGAHGDEVCIVFAARNGPDIVVGVVHHLHARA